MRCLRQSGLRTETRICALALTILFVSGLFCAVPLNVNAQEVAATSDGMEGILSTKHLKVYVYYIYKMDPMDINSAPDFYWKAKCDGVWSPTSATYHDQNIVDLRSTPWTHEFDVTYTAGVRELVIIELWDDDGLFDDRADINRTSSRNGAQLWVDMSTGDWNGYDDNYGGIFDVKFYLNGNEDGTGPYPDPDDNDCYLQFNISVY